MVYSYYFPSFGYLPPELIQDYTPVAIDYKAAILCEDETELYPQAKGAYKPKYHLRISYPRSTRKGLNQHIPDSVVVPIAADGVFRYKLAPSTVYYPVTKYIVEYFKRGNSIPLDTQEWSVPPVPKTKHYLFNYEEDTEEYVLPLNVWSVTGVDPVAEFISTYNRLTFIGNLDFVNNQAITVSYQPAVTLDLLLSYNFNNINQATRVRG